MPCLSLFTYASLAQPFVVILGPDGSIIGWQVDTPIEAVATTESGTPYPPQLGPEPSQLPKLHPDWTTYTGDGFATSLLVQGNWGWEATTGGVMRWDTQSKNYVKVTTDCGFAVNCAPSYLYLPY